MVDSGQDPQQSADEHIRVEVGLTIADWAPFDHHLQIRDALGDAGIGRLSQVIKAVITALSEIEA